MLYRPQRVRVRKTSSQVAWSRVFGVPNDVPGIWESGIEHFPFAGLIPRPLPRRRSSLHRRSPKYLPLTDYDGVAYGSFDRHKAGDHGSGRSGMYMFCFIASLSIEAFSSGFWVLFGCPPVVRMPMTWAAVSLQDRLPIPRLFHRVALHRLLKYF